jgi:hypothetical protein
MLNAIKTARSPNMWVWALGAQVRCSYNATNLNPISTKIRSAAHENATQKHMHT